MGAVAIGVFDLVRGASVNVTVGAGGAGGNGANSSDASPGAAGVRHRSARCALQQGVMAVYEGVELRVSDLVCRRRHRHWWQRG